LVLNFTIIKLIGKFKYKSKNLALKILASKILSYFGDKYAAALAFQTVWSKEFKNNKSRVLEYWKKYRYFDEINVICKITNSTRVLDVGCGVSTVLHYINGKRYGIDPLANEYKKLYSYPEGISIKRGFGEEIPFPNECFDVVFCSNVLDHVTNPQKTIDEVFRVLKTKAYFVLTVEIFKKKIKRKLAHTYGLTKGDIYCFLGNKFKIIFERESLWIGLRQYCINGSREYHNKELIVISQKTYKNS